MLSRIVPVTIVTLALWTPGSLTAQTATVETSVTFVVPVNLTQLSPDLEKVRFACGLTSSALQPVGFNFGSAPALLTPMDSVFVTSGQVITTMKLVYPIFSGWLVDPIGKQADYLCRLQGFSTSLRRWDDFSETATDVVFRLKPTPPVLQGSFVW